MHVLQVLLLSVSLSRVGEVFSVHPANNIVLLHLSLSIHLMEAVTQSVPLKGLEEVIRMRILNSKLPLLLLILEPTTCFLAVEVIELLHFFNRANAVLGPVLVSLIKGIIL